MWFAWTDSRSSVPHGLQLRKKVITMVGHREEMIGTVGKIITYIYSS